MKILLFGKAGRVGWELQRSLAPLGALTALDFESTDFHADFSRPAALAETVRSLRTLQSTRPRANPSSRPA